MRAGQDKYLEQIKHDIRNFKKLTNQQITHVLCLPQVEKNEVLLLYNEMMEYIQILFKDL